MSELNTTHCGCNCDSNCGGGRKGNTGMPSCLWLILLLTCCGGCGGYTMPKNGCGNDNCMWLVLLLLCCGGFGGPCDCR